MIHQRVFMIRTTRRELRPLLALTRRCEQMTLAKYQLSYPLSKDLGKNNSNIGLETTLLDSGCHLPMHDP